MNEQPYGKLSGLHDNDNITKRKQASSWWHRPTALVKIKPRPACRSSIPGLLGFEVNSQYPSSLRINVLRIYQGYPCLNYNAPRPLGAISEGGRYIATELYNHDICGAHGCSREAPSGLGDLDRGRNAFHTKRFGHRRGTSPPLKLSANTSDVFNGPE